MKVPDDMPLDVACVIGCAVQTGVGAVLNTAKVEPGATVLVMGLGGIGLSIVQGARLAGAARIIASDPVAERREAALRVRRDRRASTPTPTTSSPRARELTGVGVDYAFERRGRGARRRSASRRRATAARPCSSARRRSTRRSTIDPPVLFGITEKKLIGCILGSCNSLRDIPRLVALWRAGPARPRGADHRPPPARRDQRGVRRPARRRGIRTVIDLL